MGKILIVGVALLFLGVVRLSSADFEGASIPFLRGAEPANPALASAAAIGTPAAIALPESDPTTWFVGVDDASGADVTPWADILQFAAAASTPGGWAEACAAISAVADADRTANPPLGALACSDDPTVTVLQQFAVELLAARAEVSLWLLGTSGHDAGMVAGRLAEVRNSCENGLPARLAGAESAYPAACETSLAATTLPGDAEALATALGEAYELVALDLAVRDPSIDLEPPARSEPSAEAPAAETAEESEAEAAGTEAEPAAAADGS